jgi:SPX domain
MVEFGLKLEDNKVSEWSDKYMDYEALKTILKKASAAVKRNEEFMKRYPQLAEAVVKEYTPTPLSSQLDLQAIASDGLQLVDQVPETKPLLKWNNENYGSQGSFAESENKSDSISHTIKRTLSGLSGWGESHYAHRIRESIKEVENYERMFEESIRQEVRTHGITSCCLLDHANLILL